jgi:hypothetical protein
MDHDDQDPPSLTELFLLASEELRAIAEGTRKLLDGEPNDTIAPPEGEAQP